MLNVSRNNRNYQDGAVVGYQLTDRWQSGEGMLGMKLNLLMCGALILPYKQFSIYVYPKRLSQASLPHIN